MGIDVDHAARLLEQGKLVAIPTVTVYGLAGNALDINAIGEIYLVKNRPIFNPLILHVPNLEIAQKYVTHFPKEALKLSRQFCLFEPNYSHSLSYFILLRNLRE